MRGGERESCGFVLFLGENGEFAQVQLVFGVGIYAHEPPSVYRIQYLREEDYD